MIFSININISSKTIDDKRAQSITFLLCSYVHFILFSSVGSKFENIFFSEILARLRN